MTPEAKQITRKMYRATTKAGLKKLRRMTDKALGGRGFKAPSLEVLDTAIRQAEHMACRYQHGQAAQRCCRLS
jgi:hypothetical protein